MTFGYVYTRNAVYTVSSRERVAAGDHTLGLEIRKPGENTGIVTLFVDNASVAQLELPQLWPIYAANAGIRCGENRHAPVTRAYEPPFIFEQQLRRVIVDVDMP